MADVFLEWQGDFQLSATGDLLVIDGDVETRQRLERRLFTAVQGYIWHLQYGAGLPQKIGGTLSVADIKSVVNSQIGLEATVAPNPPPFISVAADPNNRGNVQIAIKYFDQNVGQTISFSITA